MSASISKNKKIAAVYAVCAVLWAAVIFMFSAESGDDSSDLSGGVVSSIIDLLDLDHEPDWLEYAIRKLAHFSEYFILGTLVFLSFYYLFKDKNTSALKCMLTSVPVCAVYASSDELHQHFVAGRSPQIKDVCIDTAGAALAAALITLAIILLKKRTKERNANEV